jgi:type IV secretory pathway VirB3-like protein
VLPFLFIFFIFSSLPRWQCMMLVVNIATQKGLKRKETFFCSVLQLFEKKVKKRNSHFYPTNAVK